MQNKSILDKTAKYFRTCPNRWRTRKRMDKRATTPRATAVSVTLVIRTEDPWDTRSTGPPGTGWSPCSSFWHRTWLCRTCASSSRTGRWHRSRATAIVRPTNNNRRPTISRRTTISRRPIISRRTTISRPEATGDRNRVLRKGREVPDGTDPGTTLGDEFP